MVIVAVVVAFVIAVVKAIVVAVAVCLVVVGIANLLRKGLLEGDAPLAKEVTEVPCKVKGFPPLATKDDVDDETEDDVKANIGRKDDE